MILEEEEALLAAPKEAVTVAFICNLRGSVCRLSADTMFPAKLAKEARKLAGGAVYYAGTWLGMGGTQLETTKMAEVHRSKSLGTRGENFIWWPAVNFSHSSDRKSSGFSYLSHERCTIIPENDLASVTYLWAEREKGRHLP
jgi:hypothetical protein